MTGSDDVYESLSDRLGELLSALRTSCETAEVSGDTTTPAVMLMAVRPALHDAVAQADSPAAVWSLAGLASDIVDRALPPGEAVPEAYQHLRHANDELKASLARGPSRADSAVPPPEPEHVTTSAGLGAGSGSSPTETGPGERSGEFASFLEGLINRVSDEQFTRARTAVREATAAVRQESGAGSGDESDEVFRRIRSLGRELLKVLRNWDADDDDCNDPVITKLDSLQALAAAQAHDYESSDRLRICFLQQAFKLLHDALPDPTSSIPVDLIAPITNVIEAVMDDDNPAAPPFKIRQLDRMIGLKQDITPLLQRAVQNAGQQPNRFTGQKRRQAFLPPVASRPGS